jgi:hypothetical protein
MYRNRLALAFFISAVLTHATWAAITLDSHGIGTQASGAGTSNTVTVASVAQGARYALIWTFCADINCTTNIGITSASSITGTRGETCTEDGYVEQAQQDSLNTIVYMGGGTCTATTSAGSDTFTVTFSPTLYYITVMAVGFNGALGADPNCGNVTGSATQVGTWSVTTRGNVTLTNEGIVLGLSYLNPQTGTPTASIGTLLDSLTSVIYNGYAIAGIGGSTFTFNGTSSNNESYVASIQCFEPAFCGIHTRTLLEVGC